MNLVRPLLGADGIAVQRIHNRIAAMLLLLVARRQKHKHVAIDSISFEIALKCGTVDLDMLHGDRLGAGNDSGDLGLYLGPDLSTEESAYQERRNSRNISHDSRASSERTPTIQRI